MKDYSISIALFQRGEFAMSSVDTTSAATVSQSTGPSGGDRVLAALQSVGRSLMLPIAVLPAAALLLRFGSADLLNLPWMAAAGNAVFSNLALIFAIGIVIGIGGDGAAGRSEEHTSELQSRKYIVC